MGQKDKKIKARETGLFLAYENFIKGLQPSKDSTVVKNTEFYNKLAQWHDEEKQNPIKTPKDLIVHVP